MMKTLIAFILLLTVTICHAQVSLSVRGVWNNSNAAVKNSLSNSRYVSHAGWQAGLRAEYTMKNWLLYAGLGVDKLHLFDTYTDYDHTGVDYKPVYLSLPVGLGYNFSLFKNIDIRLYGGLYLSQGVGGKYYSKRTYMDWTPGWMCDPGPCPEVFDVVDRKIRYGNKGNSTNGDDLVATNWGTQFGMGLAAWHKWELIWMYNIGMNNMLPDGMGDGTHRLRSVSLDLKYNLPVTKQAAKK